jgi:hypothetical protein
LLIQLPYDHDHDGGGGNGTFYSLSSKIYSEQLPVQSVPITTKVVSLNPADGEVYSKQLFELLAASQ